MANRKRDVQILLWVTPEEKKMIRKRMILSKTSNMSVYLRKMAIDGMIVNTDTTYLKAMYQEMHKIGVNINQLAKVANTVGTATPQDIEELKEMVKKIWLTLRSFRSCNSRRTSTCAKFIFKKFCDFFCVMMFQTILINPMSSFCNRAATS